MRRFLREKYRKYHLRSLWRFVMPVTVRRWHRSATAEGIWETLTKCGVTECVTDRHSHDGLSCWFFMQFRELVQYTNSKSLSVLERRPSTDRCACDDPSYLLSRLMKRAAKEIVLVWDDGVYDGPSWPRWSVARYVDPATF